MKKFLLGGFTAAGLLLGGLAINSGSVSAQAQDDDKPGQEVCPDLGSGHKTPPTGTTFLLKADPGFLITEYCVKAGSDTSVPDGAVVYVVLATPVAEVTLNGPGGKNISHYSFSQAPVPPPDDEEETTTTSSTTTTTTTTAPPPQAPAQPQTAVAAAGPVPPAAAPAAAPPAPAQTALPSTGSSSWGLALTALASLLGGLGLVKLSRRTS